MYELNGEEFFCPMQVTLHILNDKWKLFIVYSLLDGAKRFKEICDTFPSITQKTVSIKLKELEASQMITRTVYAQVPPKVEYALSATGKKIEPMVKAMYEFGLFYVKQHGCEKQ
ncbi:winged helix-turn-helix transcriptional regulator [Sulfurospirillum barnesii]|uniref:Putative transcriptional regulator n=1 Tax=Sulfurospirillum barnesii (strain ATCC 700032 / DSM 10660 / SES-3) TaxID=760154 RepID=I3Y0B8_SULBS|nr:helix-turn-helix domain-containing protein [Sulfurospirillum barnesii]AFL69642.1 putative transcriptional regulator [Sulfurospirillum barnesii SES-3]